MNTLEGILTKSNKEDKDYTTILLTSLREGQLRLNLSVGDSYLGFKENIVIFGHVWANESLLHSGKATKSFSIRSIPLNYS